MNIQMILAHSQDIKCAICLELINNSSKKITRCNHEFHRDCLDRVRTNTCPLCRNPLRANLRTRTQRAITYSEAYLTWINSEDTEDELNRPFEQFRGTGRLEMSLELHGVEIAQHASQVNLLQF
jgi:hypothetical protein